MHYGLTTNASYTTINFDLKVYTLENTNAPGSNDLLFSKTTVPFNYDGDDTTYIG